VTRTGNYILGLLVGYAVAVGCWEARAAVRGVAPLGIIPTPVTTTSLISGGTKFVAAGCANSATVGGAIAGQFTSGTTGACTVTITLPAAPNGWTCIGSDLNTDTVFPQTTSSTTSCGISATTTSGDIVHFMAIGY
jgi:hypothetical protein